MSAPVTVERAIAALLPDAEALPGSTFHVELRIRAHRRVVGLGVRERPPEGWALSPVANDGADYNPDTREWVFTEPLESGEARTLRYRITVPARAQPGSYAFTGEFVAGVPDYQAEIGGNREAHVVLALPIPVAVSRLDANGEIDLRRSNRITFDQILQATALWKRQAPVPGTDGRQIDLSLLVTLIAHWRTGTPVDEPLPGEAE